MDGPKLVKVGPENLDEMGIGCLLNPGHEGYDPKVRWLRERFDEGLRFFLFRDGDGRPLAFLEFVPGRFAWRPVEADGWLFIHCLWVYARGQKVGGLGSRLIQACVHEAREGEHLGVATLASEGPWMAGKEVFLKNGFHELESGDRFQLLARRLQEGPGPRMRSLEDNLDAYQNGLHLIYSPQCPMLPKSVNDLREMCRGHGIELQVTELTSASQAQKAPSYYGVFNLVWNGRLLSDHYVSKGRFKNLLKKEIRSGVD
jgi:hypothetical protein